MAGDHHDDDARSTKSHRDNWRKGLTFMSRTYDESDEKIYRTIQEVLVNCENLSLYEKEQYANILMLLKTLRDRRITIEKSVASLNALAGFITGCAAPGYPHLEKICQEHFSIWRDSGEMIWRP